MHALMRLTLAQHTRGNASGNLKPTVEFCKLKQSRAQHPTNARHSHVERTGVRVSIVPATFAWRCQTSTHVHTQKGRTLVIQVLAWYTAMLGLVYITLIAVASVYLGGMRQGLHETWAIGAGSVGLLAIMWLLCTYVLATH